MDASRLKGLGLELMSGLSSYYKNSSIKNSKHDWEFKILDLNNGFNIRMCKWRQGAMPAYIILYIGNKYIFELDLSMLIFMDNAFTWYFKKKISNDKSREVILSFLGESDILPDDYRNEMLGNKKEARSGKDTPANGYMFVDNVGIDDVAVKLGKLFDALIVKHDIKRTRTVKKRLRKDAKNDDVNNKQFGALTVRQGQGAFRQNLLDAYEEHCAITGWAPSEVLDACHIESHSIQGNNETNNGILLRSDLHNLFDKGLLKIHYETYKVEIHPSLKDTKYWSLNDKKLKSSFKPGVDFLRERYNNEYE